MAWLNFLSSPVFLTLMRLSQQPEENGSGGLPLVVVPVIILLVVLLIFLSSYFTSTGIQGRKAAGTATSTTDVASALSAGVAHAPHHSDEHATETAVVIVEEKETAVTLSEPVPSAITLVEAEPAPVVPDDLKIVEGIGPRIEGILQAAGIVTFTQLADADVSRLEQIVREEAGIRIAFPDTWPEQARLAAAGDWAALEKLQGELRAGRRE